MSKHKKSNKEDWSYYLVPGRVKRIKIDDKDDLDEFRCTYCNRQKGELHFLACPKERSPCNFHKTILECTCPIKGYDGEIIDL